MQLAVLLIKTTLSIPIKLLWFFLICQATSIIIFISLFYFYVVFHFILFYFGRPCFIVSVIYSFLIVPDYSFLLVNFFNELRFPLLKSSYHYTIVNFLLMLLPSRFLFPYFSINFSIQNTNLYFIHLILYSLFTNHQAVCLYFYSSSTPSN